MPPVSRFGGGGRAEKKQGVIDKLKVFFEKYFGVGGSSSFEEREEAAVYAYEAGVDEMKVAEDGNNYVEKTKYKEYNLT